MIQANELRIGNWIYCEDTNIVYQVDANGILIISRTPDNRFPIPLTPEILKKCGLDKVYVNVVKSIKISIFNGKAYISNSTGTSATIVLDVSYVHLLQNIFFALTGEELPIEL